MDLYDQLLSATIERLEMLRGSGVKYVTLEPEVVNSLTTLRPARKNPVGKDFFPAPSAVLQPVPQEPGVSRPSAQAAQSKQDAFAALEQKAKVCVKCPNLVASRRSVVFGVGNIDSPLMFVGEAPGADEDIQGEPFVGRAGQLLTKIIQAMGLSREQVYIANILKCRPDMPANTAGNRRPTPEEMQTCIPYLEQQIDLIKPKVLVALGGIAVEGLTQKESRILSQRGKWLEYRNIPMMPTLHPSYVLRQGDNATKRMTWEDMLQVMEKLVMPISEKQRAFFTKA
jgi:DNA polymerase